MFVLILVALAICRFHVKRRWSFRYYTNSGSTESDRSLPAGGRIISSINIRPTTHRNQRSRRSHQLSGIFSTCKVEKISNQHWWELTLNTAFPNVFTYDHTITGIRGASRPHPPITLHDLDIYFSSLRNVDASSGSSGKSYLRKIRQHFSHVLIIEYSTNTKNLKFTVSSTSYFKVPQEASPITSITVYKLLELLPRTVKLLA